VHRVFRRLINLDSAKCNTTSIVRAALATVQRNYSMFTLLFLAMGLLSRLQLSTGNPISIPQYTDVSRLAASSRPRWPT
jgi:hypothetical protein